MKCPTCNQEIGKFVSDEQSMKEHGECKEKVRLVMDIWAFISEKNKKVGVKITYFFVVSKIIANFAAQKCE